MPYLSASEVIIHCEEAIHLYPYLYHFNLNLHTEAEYAFNSQKRIVALQLEDGYTPDGWLGPLCRNNLYYDFSAQAKFDDEWNRLHAKLAELNLSAGGQS